MSKKIIFNEEEFAISSLSPAKPHIYSNQEAIIIAKYLNTQLPSELVRSTLIQILTLSNTAYNPVTRYNQINIALANSHLPLRTAYPVHISQSELNFINSFSLDSAKVLFTMLVIARFNRTNPPILKDTFTYTDTRLRCNTEVSEIFRLAKVSMKKIESVFEELQSHLIMSLGKNYKVIRILPFQETATNQTITIHDFPNLIQYFLRQSNPTIKECTRCHHIFQTKTKHTTCHQCRTTQPKLYFCQECGKISEKKHKQMQCKYCENCYKKKRHKLQNNSHQKVPSGSNP